MTNDTPSPETNEPAGWFNWNEYHGYQQVAAEYESPPRIPLYKSPPPENQMAGDDWFSQVVSFLVKRGMLDADEQYGIKDILVALADNYEPAPQEHVTREDIARIINPVNFKMDAGSYGTDEEGFKKTLAYGHQLVALDRADAILSLLTPSPQSILMGIKLLEWKDPTQKALVAEPLPGFKYTILDDERGVDWSVTSDEVGWNPADSVDNAKAACQADFGARLRSFITTEAPDAQ